MGQIILGVIASVSLLALYGTFDVLRQIEKIKD